MSSLETTPTLLYIQLPSWVNMGLATKLPFKPSFTKTTKILSFEFFHTLNQSYIHVFNKFHVLGTRWIGWVDPRIRLEAVGKKKSFAPSGN